MEQKKLLKAVGGIILLVALMLTFAKAFFSNEVEAAGVTEYRGSVAFAVNVDSSALPIDSVWANISGYSATDDTAYFFMADSSELVWPVYRRDDDGNVVADSTLAEIRLAVGDALNTINPSGWFFWKDDNGFVTPEPIQFGPAHTVHYLDSGEAVVTVQTVGTVTGNVGGTVADLLAISGSTGAADNLEELLDQDAVTIPALEVDTAGDLVIGVVNVAVVTGGVGGSVTGSVGSVVGDVGGNVVGTVDSVLKGIKYVDSVRYVDSLDQVISASASIDYDTLAGIVNDTLTAQHGSGAWTSGSGGAGAYICSVLVVDTSGTDDTLTNVYVTVKDYSGTQKGRLSTGSAGDEAVFGLDNEALTFTVSANWYFHESGWDSIAYPASDTNITVQVYDFAPTAPGSADSVTLVFNLPTTDWWVRITPLIQEEGQVDDSGNIIRDDPPVYAQPNASTLIAQARVLRSGSTTPTMPYEILVYHKDTKRQILKLPRYMAPDSTTHTVAW